jgi:hypothetical protein
MHIQAQKKETLKHNLRTAVLRGDWALTRKIEALLTSQYRDGKEQAEHILSWHARLGRKETA